MEGSGIRRCGRRRRSTPEMVDLEEELIEAASAPVVVVDLEVEEDDDDIIILDDTLEVSFLRAVSPEIEILDINPERPPEVIDLISDSDLDSDVEVLETSLARSPMVVSVEEEEESLLGRFEEEIEGKEEEAGVVSQSSETCGAFSLSALKQELPEVTEVSSSTVSMSDIKKEKEVEPNDVQVVSMSMSDIKNEKEDEPNDVPVVSMSDIKKEGEPNDVQVVSMSDIKNEKEEEPNDVPVVSMSDTKKEGEPNDVQLGDVKSVVESMVQVTISESGNSTSEGISSDAMQLLGALGLSPQPSSSKGVLAIGNLSINCEDHSAEIMRGGNTGVSVEREGNTAKPRIVYITKPDYSPLSEKEKADLRDQLLRKMIVLQGQCKLGQDYHPRYPPDFIKMENGCKTVVIKDKDGVERKLIFKEAECREADERKADPAFELPPRPTPTYLEILLAKMSDNAVEGTRSTCANKMPDNAVKGTMDACATNMPDNAVKGTMGACATNMPDNAVKGTMSTCAKKEPAKVRKMTTNLEKKQGKFEGPAWDSQEDVDKFCKDFNEAFDGLVKENENKKKAKAEARIREKENRKKAIAAMMAEIEQGERKKTRLSTGAITRKVVMSRHSSANSSPALKNQQRKRKGSEMGTSSEIDFSPAPPLCRRPLSRPEPSVFKAPIPLPPPTPTLPTPEPQTSQSAEERLASCPLENKAGWIKADEWEIEGIVDVKVEKNDATGKQRVMYKVKWKDWDRTHNSWVADKHIISKTTIKTFWRRFKKTLSYLNAQQRIPATAGARSLKTTGYFLP